MYLKLESWHYLSFLRSRENVRLIESLRAQSDVPERLDRLLEIVQNDLGYHLHRAVQRAKVDLSLAEEAQFAFTDASMNIHRRVKRSQFETWIAPDLERIKDAVRDVLAKTGVTGNRVDRVFLTGGSSLVPAVRKIFAAQFGAAKLAGGEEFTSVARGLALRARHSG